MANLYVREAFPTLDYEQEASEAITEGELVVRESGGGVHVFDPATDSQIDGIVPHQNASDRLTKTEEDFTTFDSVYTYDTGDGPVPIQPLHDKAHIQPVTVKDETETEPAFSKNDEVGVAIIAGDQVVVPAGYTDSAGTQYGNGGTGDYAKLGAVDAAPDKYDDAHGERVETRTADDNL